MININSQTPTAALTLPKLLLNDNGKRTSENFDPLVGQSEATNSSNKGIVQKKARAMDVVASVAKNTVIDMAVETSLNWSPANQ